MKKGLIETGAEIRRKLEDAEQRLSEYGEQAPQELREQIARLRTLFDSSSEEIKSIERNIGRLKRIVSSSRPSYEAMTVEMPKWRTTILLGLNSAAIVPVLVAPQFQEITLV